MNGIIHILITISILLGVFFGGDLCFAASGKINKNISSVSSGSNNDSDTENNPNNNNYDSSLENREDEKEELGDYEGTGASINKDASEKIADEEKVKKDINTYIIDSYKAQGTKILKDLDIKLQKTIPDPTERKEAYKKIRTALELRKKRVEGMKKGDIKKMILEEFLDHLTENLNKKIDEIRT